jgi:ABC-type transport system involved in cytochrome c biogenesis permease subunit
MNFFARNKFVFLSIIIIGVCSPVIFAQEICPLNGQPLKPKTVSAQSLKYLPILDAGRIKPLDTYARSLLLRFSGKSNFDKKPAIQWLARVLFAPDSAKDDEIFLINNPLIAQSLGVEVSKHRRYTYAQLEEHISRIRELAIAAQQIDSKKRDIVESEIIRLFENLKTFSLVSLNLSFAFPHPDFTITDENTLNNLELPDDVHQFSFLDMALRAQLLYRMSESLENLNPAQWSDGQREIIIIVDNLFQWASVYHSFEFAIIPEYSNQQDLWLSPWDAMMDGLPQKDGRNEIGALRDMTLSYWTGKQIDFDIAARNLRQSVGHRLQGRGKSIDSKINLEIFVNNLQPFFISKFIYFLSLILLVVYLGSHSKRIYQICSNLIIFAFLLHLLGIILRIIILTRPPVSTLYETFVFVSLICAASGIFIETFKKEGIGLFISSIAGFIFLTIAGKFSMEGDTLQMLVAVLNSNFWLSTHVLSITTGYAGACVAGIIGHVYIVQTILHPKDKTLLDSTYKLLLGAMGFGLTMTFLGTNLGGIWADQSWGRFWGWDPKENGALLIILWIALIFHAKIAKIIGQLGVSVMNVLGIIVVMWAWFGVNLLSIGLHSYGFTSGLAVNLLIYGILQIVFLLISVPWAHRRLKA